MSQRRTVVLVAALLISLLGASVFVGVPYVGVLFMVVSIMALMFLTGTLMRSQHERKYTDPYDLNLLREIHERAEFDRADNQREEGDIVCPHCGHVHGPMLKVCPECKRTP